ncbi:MAG: hypothetical protein HXS54_12260 [Theionarchaea archaeon]|nr:hypothetical protein [Theionarchaea archaeon]
MEVINLDRKMMLIVLVVTGIVSLAVTSGASSPASPLFHIRMEQQSESMNFLPTPMSSFSYTCEKGYSLNCDVTGCYNVQPCSTFYTCSECTTIEITCYTCDTCLDTCPNTCESTCPSTCNTCVQTCPATCVNTCPSTCRSTCWDTCWNTCWNTCEYTCEGPECTTIEITCYTCYSC